MSQIVRLLTPAQESRLIEWRDKWIAIGLSTEPADRPRAEAAYRACYRYAGLRDDAPVVWVQSPIVGASVIAAIAVPERSTDAHTAVYSAMRIAVGVAVDSAMSSAVRSAVDKAVRIAVRSAVDSAVDSAMGIAVGIAVDSTMDTAMRSAVVGSDWNYWLGGSFLCAWPAYESFFREVCGLSLRGNLTQRAAAFAECSISACYWWPTRDFIVACERPSFIKMENGRLHSASGHAIEWPDGWGLSAWRGTFVPDGWTTGNPPHPDEVLCWRNLEQRQAACEIIGWHRILDELPSREIDRDADPEIGTLVEVNLPDAEPQRFLRVKCATGREFALRIPRKYNTALAANAATYNIPTDLLELKEHRT